MQSNSAKIYGYVYILTLLITIALPLVVGLLNLFGFSLLDFGRWVNFLSLVYLGGVLAFYAYQRWKALKNLWAGFRHNRRQEEWKKQLAGYDSVIVYTIRTEKDLKPRIEIDRHLLWLGFDPQEIDAVWKVFNAQPR